MSENSGVGVRNSDWASVGANVMRSRLKRD
jgi:hypothetical protein